MATGDIRVHAAESAAHGTTTINSATHFLVAPLSVKSADPGPAGSPGLVDEQVTDRGIAVTVWAEDPDELMALVEAAAANFVGGFIGEAGASKTVTVKNVAFNDPAQVSPPPKDSGSPVQVHSITGRAQWGSTDTWATMLVHG